MAVDPRRTTQFGYSCLTWAPKDLFKRQHRRSLCGIKLKKDKNSAIVINKLALSGLGYAPGRGGEYAHG
ncbi:MAG: hypothetical protein ACP5KV_02595 [Candidatus Methanomethylicaceae archaeon]